MRLLNRRPLVTVLVLSIVTLFLAAACAGPEGTTGPQGATGATGAAGPAGAAGATGSAGAKGDKGAQGDKGAKGDTGPAGPTMPVSLAVVPTGESSGSQPAVIVVGAGEPKITVYASGLPAGDLITVELVVDDTLSYLMSRISSGSDSAVRASGAYMAKFQAPTKLTPNVPAGLYTIRLTAGPSGIAVSAAVLLVTSK